MFLMSAEFKIHPGLTYFHNNRNLKVRICLEPLITLSCAFPNLLISEFVATDENRVSFSSKAFPRWHFEK